MEGLQITKIAYQSLNMNHTASLGLTKRIIRSGINARRKIKLL